MWGDEKFRQLSAPKPNAQSLWLFLLCGPQTQAVPGLFSAGEAALAEMLGWSVRSFRRVWRELEAVGMARADWRARVVWIPKAVDHNPPESPNVVKSWRSALADVPECDLKRAAIDSLSAHCKARDASFAVAFSDAINEIAPVSASGGGKASGKATPKASGNQEQEQDQEQEQELRGTEGFAEGDPLFERFWAVYPRQDGKPAALKVWREIRPNERLARDIVAGVNAHRATKSWRDAIRTGDMTFVPLPKTYLSDGRWMDLSVRGGTTAIVPGGCRNGHIPPCATDVECTERYLRDRDLHHDAAPVVEAAS